ncbi:MAG: hypothetical protein ABDH28_05900 [Brevinematia bacterium]
MKGLVKRLWILSFIIFSFCVPQTQVKDSLQTDYREEKEYKQETITIGEKSLPKETLSKKGIPLNWVQAHAGYIYYIDISPDGKLMVSGGSDKCIKVWDISKLPQIREVDSVRRQYQALWGPPVKFSEDGNYIFSGSYDFVEVFDKNLNFIHNLRISDKGIQSIEIYDKLVFASDVNGFVYKLSFDGKKLNLEAKRKIHDEEIWKIKISPTGKHLLTASQDKTSKILKVDSLDIIKTLRAHAGPLEFVDFSKDKIALFSADSYISVWNRDYELVGKIFDSDKKDIIVGIFDRSGKYIISGGKSYKIKVWDSEKLELRKTLEWHSNDIMSLRISVDNSFLISGDRDGKIAIWEF